MEMKKVFLLLALTAGLTTSLNAQNLSKAIGLRAGWGAELSYQHPVSTSNRIELDLGLNFLDGTHGIFAVGIYQWVWDLSRLAPGFNWYAGAGPAVGLYTSSFAVGAVGQVGIEYKFKIPLQVSLDYRPGYIFVSDAWPIYDAVCAGVRYTF